MNNRTITTAPYKDLYFFFVSFILPQTKLDTTMLPFLNVLKWGFVCLEQSQDRAWRPKSLMCSSFVFSVFSFQMQCGQQSITSGMAQSHHHPFCRKWEVVSGPSCHPIGKHSSHGIQHQDPKCWHPRWRALCLLNPDEQETKIHKSASHCSR